MGIVDEDIARVRESSDIVALVTEHVQLKRVGRRWQGLCPFHAEKSPSFSVNQEEGLYYCFGCGAKGDSISFVRDIEHLDFPGAVEKLAAKAGITLRYTDRQEEGARKRRTQLTEALQQAVAFYHERLLSSPDAAEARSYLRSRGIDGDEVRTFMLGWAPAAWDELARSMKVPADVFVDSGLGFRNRNGRLTDAFRGRVLFPIFDAQDRPVGFGGRVLPGAEGPKYKNSADSPVYHKSRTLYALNWMKGAIVAADEVIICEGYTDVLGFAKAGIPRAVATCGTALTEDHVRAIKSYAHRVVLSFDADTAGQAAAARFYEWEERYGLDVAVAVLPSGQDPGDLARSDPEALLAAVERAQPFLRFRLERVLAEADLRSPEGRARGARGALSVIAEHPSDLVRDQYLMEVADRTRIEPQRLRDELRSPRHPEPSEPARGSPTGAIVPEDRRLSLPPPRETPELEVLRLLVQQPEALAGALDRVLFHDEVCLMAFECLEGADSVAEAMSGAPPEVSELLARVAGEQTVAEPSEVLLRLVERATHRAVGDLDAAAARDDDPLRYAGEIGWVKRMAEGLRSREASEEAMGQLLGWLIGRDEAPAR
jgi:DNA primase